jgi:ribosomal protein S20
VAYALEAGNKQEAQGGYAKMQKELDQAVSKGNTVLIDGCLSIHSISE